MNEVEHYLIYEASDGEFRAAMAVRNCYLDSLYYEMQARGIHPRRAQFILDEAKMSFFSGYRGKRLWGNDQLNDDRDRLNRLINYIRRS